jgi:hypothetical protein
MVDLCHVADHADPHQFTRKLAVSAVELFQLRDPAAVAVQMEPAGAATGRNGSRLGSGVAASPSTRALAGLVGDAPAEGVADMVGKKHYQAWLGLPRASVRPFSELVRPTRDAAGQSAQLA